MFRGQAAPIVGFVFILSGLLTLAYTQEAVVLPDLSQQDLESLRNGGIIGEGTGVVLAALLVTMGVLILLGSVSAAPWLPRLGALLILALVLPLFLVAQTLLVINGVAAQIGAYRWVQFSASYFFHTGNEFTFAAVYILFFFTATLVFLIVGAVGYLLAPRRFLSAVWDRTNWRKTEAIHVAATLFLLLSLSVLFFYLLRLASKSDPEVLQGRGIFGQNLVALYYLESLLLFALMLTVAAHAFLLNWGSHAPLEQTQLIENIRTIARVERGLLVAAALLNGLILISPTLPTALDLSTSFAFDFSPRGFSYAFYLLLLPYVPYALSQRRLDFLLRAGRHPSVSTPFAERSLRMVLLHITGIALAMTLAAASRWDPQILMVLLSAWTAAVLLVHSVRFETGSGLPRLAFNGEAGPAYYLVFLGLSLTTGLMLWGIGNTFEVAYLPATGSLEVVNESSNFGADVLARVAATTLIAGTLLLTLHLWLNRYAVRRRFLGHYLGIFLFTTLVSLLAFTVGVWSAGSGGTEDAYAGFAFHQSHTATERVGVGVLLTLCAMYLYFALGRILRHLVERKSRTA